MGVGLVVRRAHSSRAGCQQGGLSCRVLASGNMQCSVGLVVCHTLGSRVGWGGLECGVLAVGCWPAAQACEGVSG
jgi:hypothetical protein